MVSEIRLYVEGGGDFRDTKASLRQGFGEFLRELRGAARTKRVRWQIIVCGGRGSAYESFVRARQDHPDAFNVLLVDAEGPVTGSPSEHLRQRDQWSFNSQEDEGLHLMVQVMEAWLIADSAALESFYGQRFNANALPVAPDVEQIGKSQLEQALENATRHTQKGAYHKTRHAPGILGRVNAAIVRNKVPHCARLFATLGSKMEFTV